MSDIVRCNYKQKDYPCDVYEWKFKIMDQLNESAKWREQKNQLNGWNNPGATGDYLDCGNNKKLIERKRVIVEEDGKSTEYENMDIVCEEYNFIKSTISAQIARKKKYEGRGLVIYYLDKDRPKSSKYVGVSYNKKEKKWKAYVKNAGIRMGIGSYDTEEDAHDAQVKYEMARKR